MYYKMTITKTASSTPSESKSTYDVVTLKFQTLPDLVMELMELYPMLNSRNISKKQCIYVDKIDGDTVNVGFCISFWDDCYGECRKFHETHWIEFAKVEESPIELNNIKDHLKALEAKND